MLSLLELNYYYSPEKINLTWEESSYRLRSFRSQSDRVLFCLFSETFWLKILSVKQSNGRKNTSTTFNAPKTTAIKRTFGFLSQKIRTICWRWTKMVETTCKYQKGTLAYTWFTIWLPMETQDSSSASEMSTTTNYWRRAVDMWANTPLMEAFFTRCWTSRRRTARRCSVTE